MNEWKSPSHVDESADGFFKLIASWSSINGIVIYIENLLSCCLQGKVKDIELKGHTDSVDQLCWDPKHADLIATASGDKSVRLWDARSKLFFCFSICTMRLSISNYYQRLQRNWNLGYRLPETWLSCSQKNQKTIVGLLLVSFIFTSFFMCVYRRRIGLDQWCCLLCAYLFQTALEEMFHCLLWLHRWKMLSTGRT